LNIRRRNIFDSWPIVDLSAVLVRAVRPAGDDDNRKGAPAAEYQHVPSNATGPGDQS
jgi:hypothetical protein